MGRVFDALKQAEAKSLEVPKRRAPKPAPPAAPRPSAEAVDVGVAEIIPEPLPAAPVAQKSVPQPPSIPLDNLSPQRPAVPTMVDPLLGGDWLAQVAGADLRPGSRLGGQYRRLRDRILSQLPRGVASAIVWGLSAAVRPPRSCIWPV